MNTEDFRQGLRKGFGSAFNSRKKAFSTVFISLIFFILIALSTSIGYSSQMFLAGIEYWIPAVSFTVRGLYLNGGWIEVVLNLSYSVLIGVIITNTYTQFKNTGIRKRNLSGIAPGFLIAGCAGCGIGLLSLIGLTGIITVLPFQGTLVKIAGMALLSYFIADIGNPEICSIPSSS
ncbi:MAG: hypothetical protein ACI8Z7_000744 [Candidatus Nanohaloarchaea archaeon]|jgi:hypothetical protein